MGATISWTVSDHHHRHRHRHRRRRHHRHLSWIVFSSVGLQPYHRLLHPLLLRTHQHRSLAQNH
ncbi:hypothetical protein Hanom_Chr02g00155481 [Helianthus anomalus]